MASDHPEAHHAHHGHGHIEFRYCPRCGGGLDKRLVKASEPKRLVCQTCSFIFYQDPKVVAGTIFLWMAASFCSSEVSSRHWGSGYFREVMSTEEKRCMMPRSEKPRKSAT